MSDSTAVQITGLFLLWSALAIIPFLFSKAGFKKGWIPLQPGLFLTASLAMLGAGGVLSLLVGTSNAVLGLALGFGIVLSVFHPMAAVSFFVANLLMRPWELLPYNEFLGLVPRLMAGVALVTWLFHQARARTLGLVWGFGPTVFTALLAWIAVAIVFSGTMEEDLPVLIKTFLPIYVLSLLILNTAADQRDLRLLKDTITVAVTGVIATAIYLTITDPRFLEYGLRLKSEGLLGNSNDLGAMIAFAAPLPAISLLKREKGPRGFAADLFCLGVLMTGLLLSQSRGAIFALATAGAVYALIQSRSIRRTLVRLFMVVPIPLLFMLAIERDQSDLEGSSTSRFNYVVTGLRMVKSRPIFGVGMNNYPRLYEQYTSVFHEWGQRTAHSTWVLFMAETGLIGLTIFCLLYFSTLRKAWANRRDGPEYVLMMISYGVAMSFLSHSYTFFPYLLVFTVLASNRLLATKAVKALIAVFLFWGVGMTGANESHADDVAILIAAGSDKPAPAKEPVLRPTVSLSGARGEVLNFQIRMDATPCHPLKIEAGPLHVRLFVMERVKIEHPSFSGASVGEHYDPLIPVSSADVCASRGLRVEADPKLWLWGEIEIPVDVKPGEHIIRISRKVGSDGKIAEARLKTRVWKMRIPDEPALPAYAEYTSWFGMLGHYGKWHAGEEVLAAKYHRSMYGHRLIPLKAHLAPLKPERVGGRLFLDVKSRPTPEQSWESVTLKNRPKWALYDFPTVPPDESEAAWVDDYLRAIEAVIPSLNRPGKAFVYLWDEPSWGERTKIQQLAATLKKYIPFLRTGSGPLKGDFPALIRLAAKVKKLSPSLKVMVTTERLKELDPHVDILVPVMDHFDEEGHPAPGEYKALQKQGKQVWSYVSCMSHGCTGASDSGRPDFVIERGASHIRSIPWISARYGLDGFLYYAVVEGYRRSPGRDPWDSLWDFSGNGDGTLFYPARPGQRGFDDHVPVPSVRLKIWREASFDAEYIRWMNELESPPDWWKKELRKVAPSTSEWDRSYDSYGSLRERIGEYLDAR